jgi:hypothetical protein
MAFQFQSRWVDRRREGRALRCVILIAIAVVLLGSPACRSRPVADVGTDVASGDTLRGRLVQGRLSQAFTLEGVEASILDFDLVADQANQAAPEVALLDPEGTAVDLAPYTETAPGAATMRVRGVVLLRTGTYQVTVTPALASQPVYYSFRHGISFPPMEDYRVTLTPDAEQKIYVSAPRGGQIVVKVVPASGSDASPVFRAVEDPWGGRALDPSRRPDWAPAAKVSTAMDGTVFLNFTAPIPGRYTVIMSSRAGHAGPVAISASVKRGPGRLRAVAHPNRPAEEFGVPAPPDAPAPPSR